MLTATGFMVMCVAATSTCTANAVESPPNPCGPTPNMFTADSSIYNFHDDEAAVAPAGALPIATGMMPDDSKFYVANYLSGTLSVIDTATAQPLSTIDLLANYDPETLSPAPGIAESWDVSEDKKTVTFHLVDANWSDGKPITATLDTDE